MIRALHCRQVREQLHLSDLNQHILPYDEPDLFNDFITKDTSQPGRFIINFRRHCVLGHVLSDSDPLDNFGSLEGSCTTYQETKECRPTQIETKENNKYEENTPEEQ